MSKIGRLLLGDGSVDGEASTVWQVADAGSGAAWQLELGAKRALTGYVLTSGPDAPDADLEELFITATVTRGQDVAVTRTSHHKCGRCWRHLPEVAEDGALCARCEDVVGALEAAP